MIKLDDKLLGQLGLGPLPANLKNSTLRALYKTLETLVGLRLAAAMTDAQTREFAALVERKDDNAAMDWLEANLPEYKQIVIAELDPLTAELGKAAGWLVQLIDLDRP
jgi:Protein of unknown function (DUF5663)